jgi:hypothetical protein
MGVKNLIITVAAIIIFNTSENAPYPTDAQIIRQVQNSVEAALTGGEKESISGRVYTDRGTYNHNSDLCYRFAARQMAYLDIVANADPFHLNAKTFYDVNFTGRLLCHRYTPEKYEGHGIWTEEIVPPNGKGHITRRYKNDALREFLDGLPNHTYNILISFNTGWPLLGIPDHTYALAGHVLFIHAKIDGKLYWADSYDDTRRIGGAPLPFEAGAVNAATVDGFMAVYGDIEKYGGIFGAWAGAVIFRETPDTSFTDNPRMSASYGLRALFSRVRGIMFS